MSEIATLTTPGYQPTGKSIRTYICLVCSNEAMVEATLIAPGVIHWPHCFCATCPGNPEMAHR